MTQPGSLGGWVEEEPAIGAVLVDGEPLIEGHITGLSAHIARHDPARALREVAAIRAIVATCENDLRIGARTDLTQGGQIALYVTCKRLASIWSGHPDYQPEWR